MKTSDFDYHLSQEMIAQTPVEPRDCSRLLVLDRRSGAMEHRHFYDIGQYLRPGDVLVFNDSRVIPARLPGRKVGTGGRIEVLLLRRLENHAWQALVRGSRMLPGSAIEIDAPQDKGKILVEVVGQGEGGLRIVKLSDETALASLGKVPLPPYIHAPLADPERYQTVYARNEGSAAAPTAGLHFTPALLDSFKQKGVELLFVTLHIGLDTFQPVKEADPHKHIIHREFASIEPEVAARISAARRAGRRVIAVGTTTARVLEQAALRSRSDEIEAFEGWVDLFILPGHQFCAVDVLITNFHLPRSTLLMMVSAFAGRELILKAYEEAKAAGYRFYSFGDAMLVL